MVIKINADDIRHIVVEVLHNLSLVDSKQIESIDFIDDIIKQEIIKQKSALEIIIV